MPKKSKNFFKRALTAMASAAIVFSTIATTIPVNAQTDNNISTTNNTKNIQTDQKPSISSENVETSKEKNNQSVNIPSTEDPKGKLAVHIDGTAGNLTVTKQDGSSQTLSIDTDGHKTIKKDGIVSAVSPVNGYDLIVEDNIGSKIRLQATSEKGYDVSQFQVASDSGGNADVENQSDGSKVVTLDENTTVATLSFKQQNTKATEQDADETTSNATKNKEGDYVLGESNGATLTVSDESSEQIDELKKKGLSQQDAWDAVLNYESQSVQDRARKKASLQAAITYTGQISGYGKTTGKYKVALNGKTYPGYCIQSGYQTPNKSGVNTYKANKLVVGNNYNHKVAFAILKWGKQNTWGTVTALRRMLSDVGGKTGQQGTAGSDAVINAAKKYVDAGKVSNNAAIYIWRSSKKGAQAIAAGYEDVTPPPTPKVGYITLSKQSKNEDVTEDNPAYSLAGAKYGVYSDAGCTKKVGELTVGENGRANVLKVNPAKYYIKETDAPNGYDLDTKVYEVTVTDKNTSKFPASINSKENPVFLTPHLQKVDAENGKALPLGDASLEGAQFVFNYSNDLTDEEKAAGEKPVTMTWIMQTDSEGKITWDQDHYVGGDEFMDALPEGTLSYYERMASDGYLVNDKTFTIKMSGSGDLDLGTVKEQVQRGDLELFKIDTTDDVDGKPLANVRFKLTSKTTGESHILYTDKDGYATTATESALGNGHVPPSDEQKGHPHTYNTNKNDKKGQENSNNGIFFYGRTDGNVGKAKNNLGALPYDTYHLEELDSDDKGSTTGKDLINPMDIVIDSDLKTIKVVKDNENVKLESNAINTQDHSRVLPAEKDVSITDTVSYKNLHPGRKYTLSTELFDKSTGKALDVDGHHVGESIEFSPEKKDGKVPITVQFDADSLQGKTIVAYDYIDDANGRRIAWHQERFNTDQSVYVPYIHTTASDGQTKDHVGTVGINSSGTQEVVDNVVWGNLESDKAYHLTGTLYDKKTGEIIKKKNGRPYQATLDFRAPEATERSDLPVVTNDASKRGKLIDDPNFVGEYHDCDTTLIFKNVDTSDFAGKTVVVYEDLTRKDQPYAEHHDINDEGQTLHYPDIHTNAIDTSTKDHVGKVGKDDTIQDTVSYYNLIPGLKYTMTGKLVDKATGKPILIKGEEVTASQEFTPTEADGKMVMNFNLDASKLEGKTVVVFENLIHNKVTVKHHEDTNDEDQSIHYPKIRTTAADGKTKDQVGTVEKEATIVDTVKYWNLIPGMSYTVSGHLMDQESGQPLLDENGNQYTQSKTFTPTEANGSIDLTYKLDSRRLEGKSTVVFEDLIHNNVTVTTHSDITDEDQTIHYPEIHTTAVDSKTKDHVGSVFGKLINKFRGVDDKEDETIIDTVAYKNLIPGKEYTLSGTLMNQETGEPILIDGKKVTQTKTFTPTEADGSTDLEYHLDSSKIQGKTTVVFEDLYHNNVKVTTHSEITDKAQTVHIIDVHTTATDSQTKDHVGTVMKDAVVRDDVYFENLLEGCKYTIKGTLMDQSTGQPIMQNGKKVTSSVTFTANKNNPDLKIVKVDDDKITGYVSLYFTVDSRVLEGKTAVAFEDVYHNGVKITTHADITDERQSVHYPKIRTTAIASETKDHVGKVDKNQTITDTVAYWNLIPGMKYTISGKLMDKDSKKPLLDKNGKEITQEVTFKADKVNGAVNLVYKLDASQLEGKTVVVFEDLIHNNVVVTKHHDINDESQSVHYPKIRTHATDSKTKDHVGTVGKREQIIDNVSYWNLIPKQTYTMSGVLMDKATNKPIIQNGKKVTATKTFTPDKANGSIALTFNVDSTLLKGKTTVVFEDLLHNNVKVTTHSDIHDEAQTIHYPDIHTKAEIDGKKEAVADSKTKLIDTVTYKNLIPGKTYTMKGTIMDKKTGKALLVHGKPVKAEQKFTPTKADGEMKMMFVFDSTHKGDFTAVVFEDLVHNGVTVAAHHDINDAAQSVLIKENPQTGVTGNNLILIIAIVLVVAALAICLIIKRKKSSAQNNDSQTADSENKKE